MSESAPKESSYGYWMNVETLEDAKEFIESAPAWMRQITRILDKDIHSETGYMVPWEMVKSIALIQEASWRMPNVRVGIIYKVPVYDQADPLRPHGYIGLHITKTPGEYPVSGVE